MKVLLLIATTLSCITCRLIVGGQQTYNATLTDPFVIFAINGINEFYKASGDQRPRVGKKVVSATSQLVDGTLYRFKIKVKGGDASELCSVVVLSQPWLTVPDRLEGEPKCVPKTQS